ncbi:clarin-3 [Sinocyclocheilus anshuiensis]|uniref:clarin-3 n=1 Tax=Sinocyclocheilus anshuiensis TaxID=1608454 RepID=UPI0007B8DF6A|nr:PREDICTED: clarin-3-like [Sinocyclocheilus anshuiensis]
MPSSKKLAHFLSSAALCAAGVAVLGFGMSTNWAQAAMDCAPIDSEEFSGSSSLQIGLFNGTETKIACPRIDKLGVNVPVFERLGKLAGAPVILHALVVILLALALLGSAGSILVTLYNSFSNPYQTYMGPIGLYTCSGLSVCVASLALILYVANAYVGKMFQTLVKADEANVKLKDPKITLQVGFFLLIPYIGVNLLAILVVYLYVHAAYTRRKEQEKPTEDAPKEIMMY